MAIFNSNDIKSQNRQNSDTSTTIITIGSEIKGEMNLECNLFVDGDFEGTINSHKEITIGKNGRVKGEIYAKHLVVQGEVVGNVSVEIVEIKSTGKVSGTVESSELVIEPKGLFEGNSIIKGSTSIKSDTKKPLPKEG